jgi:tetratricopeptide (TPR) repeat protein
MSEISTTFDTPTVQYGLLNFQPVARNEQVSAWLQGKTCPPLVLRGEPGSGRTYLLEAACQNAKPLHDMPFKLAVLDWAEIVAAESPQAYFQKILQQARPDQQWASPLLELAGKLSDTFKPKDDQKLTMLLIVLRFVGQQVSGRIIDFLKQKLPDLNAKNLSDALLWLLRELAREQHLVLLLRNADHFPQQGTLTREEKGNTLRNYHYLCDLLDREYREQPEGSKTHGRVLLACSMDTATPASVLDELRPAQPMEITLDPISEAELQALLDARFQPNRFGLLKNLLGGHTLNRHFARLLYDYARLDNEGKDKRVAACYPTSLAKACLALLETGVLLKRQDGWQLRPATRDATLELLLGRPLRESYEDTLQAIPPGERETVHRFMSWAGMMNPLIPWNLLLQYFHEVEKADTEKLEANIRQHFIGTSGLLEWVVDDLPHLPESHNVSYIRYTNPLLAASLRPQETRSAWASELLKKLDQYVPQPNRSTAQLFLHLAAQAGDSRYQTMRSELGWWLDEQYASVYEAMCKAQLQMGLTTTAVLVDLVKKNRNWPMHRRRAILTACQDWYAKHGGIPSQEEARWYWAGTGALERNFGHYQAAITARRRQLVIEETKFADTDVELADTLQELAALLRMQGEYQQALLLFQRALIIKEKELGQEHESVANTLNSLAVLYEEKGNYVQALPLYECSLAIWEKVLGAEHPDVATSLNNLAGLYYAQGDTAQAQLLYERSLAIREKVLGAEHPNVANSLSDLAVLYEKQGLYAQAQPLHERSLEIREKVLGEKHPNTINSLHNLVHLYENMGELDTAFQFMTQAWNNAQQFLASDHPEIQRHERCYNDMKQKLEEQVNHPPSPPESQ